MGIDIFFVALSFCFTFTGKKKILAQSYTEENYLKIIYKLCAEANGAEASTNAVAELAQTKAASVSDMLKKLADKNLVYYKKYQGVRLTHTGEQVALRVIRKHRLWEVFLVEKLHYTWDEVHHIAEELEHVSSEKLADKLDEFLGFPKYDPHGDPIPDGDGRFPVAEYLLLSQINVGQTVLLMGVSEHSAAFLKYLAKIGVSLGSRILLAERNDYDQSISIKIDDAPLQFLTHDVAKNLLVSRS
jgi:DtxR family transcriptional regulator, Mn-dependent transcriptional regulator